MTVIAPHAALAVCCLLLAPVLSLDLAHTHRMRRQAIDDATDDRTDNNSNDDSNIPPFGDLSSSKGLRGRTFSPDEFGEKLKELLDRDRPDRRDGSGESDPWAGEGDNYFRDFLDTLDDLAERAPDDLTTFDVDTFLRQIVKPARREAALNNGCLRNPLRMQRFLSEVADAIREFREDLQEESRDAMSRDTDAADDITAIVDDMIDGSNTMDDTATVTANDDLADTGDGSLDDLINDDVVVDDDDSKDDGGGVGDAFASPLIGDDVSDDSSPAASSISSKEADVGGMDTIDMEDIFEKLTEDSMECFSAFLDDADEEMLCRQFAHRSTRVFSMFIQSGLDCSKHLEDIDDLDDAHQLALLNQMLQKPAFNWTSHDLQRALRLAPHVIDDDFLDDFSDELLEENVGLLWRVASRRGAKPGLELALRQRLLDEDLDTLDSSAISRLGKGLLALTEDQLDDLDPMALLDADLDDLFDDHDDDDDDNHGNENDDDDANDEDDDDDDNDDDDDREGRRLAIGRRMKQAQLSGPRQVGRVARFLYDDLDFLDSVSPDDLYEAVDDLLDLDLDDDEASNLFRRLSQSQSFPALNRFTRRDVQRLRSVLPGISLSQLKQLPRAAIREAVDDLKDLHFGESQARELLEELLDTELSTLTAAELRGLGRLARGLDAEDIEEMDDNVISEVLDDMDDLGLNDAQKRLFADKALKAQHALAALKLMKLPGFADALSIDDIDDLNDDDVVSMLNVSTRISWRASQAVAIVAKVKKTRTGQSLRPADIPNLGTLVRGLLPGDLDDMVDRPDDIDDLADVLGDHEDDLSSALVDRILDFIEDRDDIDGLPEIKVTADFVAQKGVFLAYLPPALFNKLDFDDAGKKAFVSLAARMDTRKLPRAQIQFLAEELLDMMEDRTGEDRDDADFRKLKQLGEFSMGLSEERLEQLSAKAVLQTLATLGTLPLTAGQARAVLDKLEEAMPDWECRSSVLANAGPLLQFAKEDTVEALCEGELASGLSVIEKRLEKWQERLEERREEGLWREDSLEAPDTPDFMDSPDMPDPADTLDDVTEDDAGRRLLVNRLLAAALASSSGSASSGAGRRRRAAVGQLTCSVMRLMRQDVAMVDVSMVTAMPDTEFMDCLEVVGNASKWNSKDLDVLLQHATQVMGSPSTWSNEVLRQAGVLTAALSPTQIRSLLLTGVDALNSMARHARLHVDQLKAGFSRWLELKKSNDISMVTPGEFASLSEFVCGLTAPHIMQLPAEVFRRALDVVGAARSCTADQRAAYTSRALQIYGDIVLNWSPAVIADMGHLIGGLSAPSVQQLTADQLALVKPSVMAHLPMSTLKAMTDSQLQQLSTNQVNALSPAHYRALSAQQQRILQAKATVSFLRSTHTTQQPGNRTVSTTTAPAKSDTTTIAITSTSATIPTTSKTAMTPAARADSTSTMISTTADEAGIFATSTKEKPTKPKPQSAHARTSESVLTPAYSSYDATPAYSSYDATPAYSSYDATKSPETVAEKSATVADVWPLPSRPAFTAAGRVETGTDAAAAGGHHGAGPATATPSTAQPPIRPGTTRGPNPGIKFSSEEPDQSTTVKSAGSSAEASEKRNGAESGARSTNSASSYSSATAYSSATGVRDEWRKAGGSGAAMASSWNLTSLLAALLFAFLM